VAPDDLEVLRSVLRLCRPSAVDRTSVSEVHFVRRLLQAIPGPIVKLSLPFGVPDMELREWIQAGLLQAVEELHLLGHGGPSDASLARMATRCPHLRRLTVLCGSLSAAAALVLHAEVQGGLSPEWWSSADVSRLRVIPRLQRALQPQLTVQRIPSWLCGQWSPTTPGWGHEVHHYDPLGRFVYLRNGLVERIGVVRSCLPSPYGKWWELDLCFFINQEWVNQLTLMLPVGPPSEPHPDLEAWGSAQEPPGIAKVAIVGSTDNVRQHPRQFPHYGLCVSEWRRWSREDLVEAVFPWSHQEWAEAAIASCGGDLDLTMVFDRADSSEEEDTELVDVTPLPSIEELLAKLDQEEARDLDSSRPSRRVEEDGTVPSVEELLAQLDREDEEDAPGAGRWQG